jgi:UPF0042 nucleotide-binding protein
MRLIIVSGRSGSGKSTALRMLEDADFSCIDNLPAKLLTGLFEHVSDSKERVKRNNVAVGIDVRSLTNDLKKLPEILSSLKNFGVNYEIVFLDASDDILIQRFSETRRKHPLSSKSVAIKEAIELENIMLESISTLANRKIDTSNMSPHQLRSVIKKQLIPGNADNMSILFESFAYKHGVPIDADFVFDVRCLPNPYWIRELRTLDGNDKAIISFFKKEREVSKMLASITNFLEVWLPKFREDNRSYVTIGIGCTGGHHRSVYVSNMLKEVFIKNYLNTQIWHRELN